MMKRIRKTKRLLREWYDYRLNPSPGLFVNWAITGRCNSRCVFCEAHEHLSHSQDMPLEKVLSIIDEFPAMNVETVVLIGGEPFLRKDIWTIIARLHEKGISIGLITNGLLLAGFDNDHLDLLKKSNASITVSLDSADPGQHDAIRGIKGNYEKTARGLAKLRDAGIHAVLSAVIMRQNIGQIPALCSLCAQWKLKKIVFQPVSHTPFFEGIDAKEVKKRLGLESEDDLALLEVSIDEGIEVSNKLGIESDLPLFKLWVIEYFRSRLDINRIEPRFYDRVTRDFSCRLVQYRLFIDYDGSIKSCQLMPAIGNVESMTLEQAWEKLKPLRKKFKDRGTLKICDNCFCNTEDNFTIGAIEHPWRNRHILKTLIR